MHDFNYRSGELYCEGVKVSEILKRSQTPAYIYSYKTFVDHIRKIQDAFKTVRPLICYSMKANSNLAILKAVVDQGAGLDIVSGGELYRAKQVQCPPERIVFAGVGKTEEEIEDALRYGILFFNAESEPELERINQVAGRLKKKASVSLRINPNVDAKTHHHITTGKKETKFGMDMDTAKSIFRSAARFRHLSLCALHVHIGSQIIMGEPFVEAFRKVLAFVDDLEHSVGVKLQYLNLGGGLGVIYSSERPQTAREFARKVLPLFKGRKFRLVFEPGRFISANAGILVTRVLYVKKTPVKQFAIVDAAMNDLIRPSLYEAYHEILPLKKTRRPSEIYDVVGPVCESGDFFAKNRRLTAVQAGDYLAVMTAGAYGFVMASNYNTRPRACEVLVKGRQFEIVRKRETLSAMISNEIIPSFL